MIPFEADEEAREEVRDGSVRILSVRKKRVVPVEPATAGTLVNRRFCCQEWALLTLYHGSYCMGFYLH